MRHLDDVDLEIVRLLAADARRPYREIAERVDLSPPAVSDRVDRLQEQGVIRKFTIDVDRSALENRTPVAIRIEVTPGRADEVFEALADRESVEHVFKLADGDVLVHANLREGDAGSWLESSVDVDALRGYAVDLVAAHEWSAEVAAHEFAIDCVVCGNEVTDEGVTAEIGGEVKAFCCPSCESRYRDRYDALAEDGA